MKWTKAKDGLPQSTWVGPTRFKGNINAWEFGVSSGVNLSQHMRQYPEIEYLDESLPASLEDEAKALYPDVDETSIYAKGEYHYGDVVKFQRSAHITCAGMYTGEIDRLKGLLKLWVAPCECETCTKNWDEYKAKHNL